MAQESSRPTDLHRSNDSAGRTDQPRGGSDAPSPATFSTGMLARGYPTVAHQIAEPL